MKYILQSVRHSLDMLVICNIYYTRAWKCFNPLQYYRWYMYANQLKAQHDITLFILYHRI